ncbi:MAG: cobyric acid synthase CobQ [Magnetovibrio sp.]|nr:cobyric acid synthase CobQ [Magnetovibrio sp.]|tara:strand:- start:10768 stop:12219 length:1452 start_codon:yes stop_codon:yes gene_type:complete
MFQGTGSDVGKSLLVAGLCRAFKQRGLKVRPFKPQNMSNNAAVTIEGGEIGRAQALQARACGLEPSIHMNPVLLKPESETGAQVIVQGKREATLKAKDYHTLKPKLLERVLDSFYHTRNLCDLVLVEGAGSAAEVNLRDADIANMGFALAVNLPVVLVGDIDRGGVIASIVGTEQLLEKVERDLLAGYIINKFRGDASLFASADKIIKEKTGLNSFGLVPYFSEARFLPKEDAMTLDAQENDTASKDICIAVPRLSRIANFDDLDPLSAEPDVTMVIVEAGDPLPCSADLILIPGTKATVADLEYIRAQGWDIDIAAHVRRGGMVVGLCGGYQILGKRISDPIGIEGAIGEKEGLGLLDVETVLGSDKTLEIVSGVHIASGEKIHGYEIHIGSSEGPDRSNPWICLDDKRVEGALSQDGRVMGSYIHGIFAADGFRQFFLEGLHKGRTNTTAYEVMVENTLDNLAEHLEENMDLDALYAVTKK